MSDILVSVLLPTRARRRRLVESVRSIYALADDPSRVEVLLRVDDDDGTESADDAREDAEHLLLRYVRMISEYRVLVGHRLKGYASLHLFYTELAEVARGKYVLIWNDDVRMETQGWDTVLAAVPDGDFIIQWETVGFNASRYTRSESGPFPIVKNGVWKDRVIQSLGDPTDTWLDERLRVERGFKTYFLEGCSVQHDRDTDEVLEEHRRLK